MVSCQQPSSILFVLVVAFITIHSLPKANADHCPNIRCHLGSNSCDAPFLSKREVPNESDEQSQQEKRELYYSVCGTVPSETGSGTGCGTDSTFPVSWQCFGSVADCQSGSNPLSECVGKY